jgi:DNA-binding CsgD family transcriptional regulator
MSCLLGRNLGYRAFQCQSLISSSKLLIPTNWSAIAARTENCEDHLTRRRKQSAVEQVCPTALLPESFVLCERSSGAVRFRVEAESDGSVPVEKIAGLLAVHCLVRGHTPEDYELMVITGGSLLDMVAERAQQLLAAGRALGSGVKVSRREQDVLDGILQRLANKEIASRLHVSERTVKFHVSSLLAKFGVTDRVALSREVSFSRMPSILPGSQPPPQALFGYPVRNREESGSKAELPRASNASTENSRTKGHVFPIFAKERFAT